MEQIKIRASKASFMMTEPKTNAAKAAGELSETTKTYLHELWLYNHYGFRKEVLTKEILKGRLCEPDARTLCDKVIGGQFRIRFTDILKERGIKYLQDDYFTGTPDVVQEVDGYVEDIKCSYTIDTFHMCELTDNYYYQGQVYMHLLGIHNYRLNFCLVKTPEQIIQEEIKGWYFKFGCNEENPDYIEATKQIEQNHNIDKVELKDRVKTFNFPYDPDVIKKLKFQVEKARNYYNTITL